MQDNIGHMRSMPTTADCQLDRDAADEPLQNRQPDAADRELAHDILCKLRTWATRFESFSTSLPTSDAARHHFVWSLSHEGVALVALAVECRVSEDLIRAAIAPVVAIQRQSPFARRLQEWPRGYPGDFETIEHICRPTNQATPGTIGWYIEEMTLNAPIAQQHRNKVFHQAALLAELALTKADARVLVVGSGAAPDVRQALPWLRASRIRIVLNDIDPDALAFCAGELSDLGDRVKFVHGNALRCSRSLRGIGPFDLVLCCGLFDYLTDRQVIFLLREFKALLLAGGAGQLFFTNIGRGNPYRCWMEYFANWRLIERDEAELRQLAGDAELPYFLALERDTTGLTWLARLSTSANDPE